jgi:hypothetical protein
LRSLFRCVAWVGFVTIQSALASKQQLIVSPRLPLSPPNQRVEAVQAQHAAPRQLKWSAGMQANNKNLMALLH